MLRGKRGKHQARPLLLGSLCAFVFLFLLPGFALAHPLHAEYISSDPAANAMLQKALTTITIHFMENVSGSAHQQPTGPYAQTQTGHGYSVTLQITHATFGTNTFTVILKDTQGRPLMGAAVLLETQMLDMDMGTDVNQLKADVANGNVFHDNAEVTMNGNWQLFVKVLPPNQKTFVSYSFKLFIR